MDEIEIAAIGRMSPEEALRWAEMNSSTVRSFLMMHRSGERESSLEHLIAALVWFQRRSDRHIVEAMIAAPTVFQLQPEDAKEYDCRRREEAFAHSQYDGPRRDIDWRIGADEAADHDGE